MEEMSLSNIANYWFFEKRLSSDDIAQRMFGELL
jgi:hypothetical protein